MEDDLIPISALQHFVYCPRQFALIHIERIWMDDAATMQGNLMHRRVNEAGAVSRPGLRIVTAMPLRSDALGLIGTADRVEFVRSNNGEEVYPVEFKRGRPKSHRADEVQLCAQALCLEEMLACSVQHGFLYYGEPHRRTEVAVDDDLRVLTKSIVAGTRALLESNRTPAASYRSSKCSRCSLFEACQPRVTSNQRRVTDWITEQLGSSCEDS